MNDFRDRPEDGISLMDTALGVFVGLGVAILAAVASWLLGLFYYGGMIEPEITAHIEREVAEKRALPPAEIAYWKRHERNSRLCRGQQWISQCCDNSLDSGSLTCLTPEEK